MKNALIAIGVILGLVAAYLLLVVIALGLTWGWGAHALDRRVKEADAARRDIVGWTTKYHDAAEQLDYALREIDVLESRVAALEAQHK